MWTKYSCGHYSIGLAYTVACREGSHALSDLEAAIEDDPLGAVCTFCGGENTFADDVGWFFAHPSIDREGYCCKQCWDGEVGHAHKARYGVGER